MKPRSATKKNSPAKSKATDAKKSDLSTSAESRPNKRATPVFNPEKRKAIMEGRIKDMYCDVCGVTGGWEYVGDWNPNENSLDSETDTAEDTVEAKYWLRCKNCSFVSVIEEWKIQINREKKLDELTIEDCITYTPQGIYCVGDAIYHKGLNKIGIVRSKQFTNSGASTITIEFQDLGMRQLLENVSIDENGTVSEPGKKGKLKLKKTKR